jgi:hypothetical protein
MEQLAKLIDERASLVKTQIDQLHNQPINDLWKKGGIEW